MADISAIKLPNGITYDIKDKKQGILFYGQVDNTSTSTVFTAQIDGITEYTDGLTVILKNGVVTSEANFTININNLGAKPSYTNLAAATRDTTIFNISYTMMFIYDSTRVEGGGWICYRGYDANTNTIGYQIRTNSMSLPMKSITYRYRILFTSADGEGFVPATNSTSTNATASRTVCQDKIDPFGRIVYYGTTASVAAGSRPGATYLWEQYVFSLGYSFNKTGAALTLTSWKPVYIKCTPQSDGSAIIDSTTPYVQTLPSTEDGKIYILLGVAYSATQVEMFLDHPVYYYKDGAVRLWTGNEPFLSGNTSNITPQEVLSALQAGKNVKITYTHELYGDIVAYNFNYSNAFDVIISNIIAKYSLEDYEDYMFFELVGIIENNQWDCIITSVLTSDSILPAYNLNGAIPGDVTATTQVSTDNSTKIATTAYVTTAISNLPEPMVFKGSVGTGGTITSLPSASSSNEGYTYKVITDISSPVSAKVGDTVISNGSSWIVIPSGDEPSGTVTSISSGTGLTGGPITSTGTIKANLNSETSLGTIGTTDKLYAVGVDSNGKLAVNVPWTELKYTIDVPNNGNKINNVVQNDITNNVATGAYSLAQGNFTTASGTGAHSEGLITQAFNNAAHSEGYGSVAEGIASHAEGSSTNAKGAYSHSEGQGTKTNRRSQLTIGEYNILDTGGTDTSSRGNWVFVIGNGEVNQNTITRSNALTVDWNGNLVTSGSITDGNGGVLLSPLIGGSSEITPSQVATALGEGRDICISHPGTLSGIDITLKFTSWNRATDSEYDGNAIDTVVSQTIAYYDSNYYLFELIGLISFEGVSLEQWSLNNTILAKLTDIPEYISELANDIGYIITETDPVFTASAAHGITSTDIANWNGKSNFSGNYNDLTNKPTIPTVNNATLTIQKNGTNVKTFTANASSNVTANITVPTKTSDLTNDSGFITGVTSTSTPTANTIAKFDSDAHMNSEDMSAQDVQDFIDELDFTPSGAVSDYVVDQGTSEGWTYRKWSSGYADCWYRGNYGNVTLSTQLSTDIVSATMQLTFPFTFIDVPSCVIGYEGSPTGYSSLQYPGTQASTTKSQGFRLARIGTSSVTLANCTFTATVHGKWK